MKKKAGIVLLLGRPNVGKSTFLNNVVGQKISITSPKPQTTRFPIEGIFDDERGQLIFVDTPGIFKKSSDRLSRLINQKTVDATHGDVDVVIYMVDHTRHRDFEEGKVLGMVREFDKPIILVVNKIDIKEPSYLAEYRFIEDEIPEVYKISSLKKQHIKPLLDALFEKVDRPYPLLNRDDFPVPTTSLNSRLFLEELIREKIYLFTRQEVPYQAGVRVDEFGYKKNGSLFYVSARILASDKRYKKMLIGAGGRMIKEIGMAARKELELSTGKKVFLDVSVEVDPHWQNSLIG